MRKSLEFFRSSYQHSCLVLRQPSKVWGFINKLASTYPASGDGRKPPMSLHRSVGMRGELLLMCLVHKMKKVVRKVREGAISLPEKYSKLLVEAIPGHKEEQLPLVGQGCKIGPRSEQKQTKEGNSFQGIMIKIPEAIDGQ